MSFGNQMLLVVLVLVLFSTVLLGVYNSFSNQSVLVGRYMYLLQAFRCADKYLQKIQSENLSKDLGFNYLWETYQDTTFVESISNIDYNVDISSSYCDSSGMPSPETSYQKIEIKVWCLPAGYDTIRVGTSSNPISIVVANMGI